MQSWCNPDQFFATSTVTRTRLSKLSIHCSQLSCSLLTFLETFLYQRSHPVNGQSSRLCSRPSSGSSSKWSSAYCLAMWMASSFLSLAVRQSWVSCMILSGLLYLLKWDSDQHESFSYFGHCAHINKLVHYINFSSFVNLLILEAILYCINLHSAN